jgi:threonine efflux protein
MVLFTLSSLVALSFSHVLAVMSPGPSIIAVTRYFIRYGAPSVFIFNIGIALGEGVLCALVLLGLSDVLLGYSWVYVFFHVFAGGYLVWIALGMIRSQPMNSDVGGDNNIVLPSQQHTLRQGFLIGSSNPKSMLFDAALLINFIPPSMRIEEKFVVWCWLVFLTFMTLTVLCLLFKRYRARLLDSLCTIERICGVVLVGLGMHLFHEAYTHLFH